MKQAKNDIAVLILFFNRPKHLEKLFKQIQIARPSRLYLFQDGARENRPDDVENIRKCREIVAEIDWECEVHRHYCTQNYGCDPANYLAHKWMFATEESGIVFEDDDIPAQALFPFCKELLEKYKDDSRINMICGMNNTGVSTHTDASYLFTQKGSIWGWASWKRVIDSWDPHYNWLDDPDAVEVIRSQMNDHDFRSFIATAEEHRADGKAYHESLNAASMFLNHRLNIVPKYNMICNIGIGEETTHNTHDIRLLPKRIQKLMFMKTYEIDFPLIHPQDIIRDLKFEKKMSLTPARIFFMRVEAAFRSFIYQDKKTFWGRVKKRLKIIFKK